MYILGYSGFTRDSHTAGKIINPMAKTDQDFDSIFEYREGEVPFSRFPLGYFGHDASAALYKDGNLLAAASEERFTRVKFSLNLTGNTLLPKNAINFCLKKADITMNDVDVVSHYCNFNEELIKKRLDLLKPWVKNDEKSLLEESYNSIYNLMMSESTVMKQFEQMTGSVPKQFISVPHHLAHAGSAFYPSGFEEALIFTIDGTGETESSLVSVGSNNKITELERTFIPTSLGALYLIITVFLGFRTLGDEYKVMGLASYGNPDKYRNFFNSLIVIGENGNYSTELLAAPNLKELLIKNLGNPRKRGEPFAEREADIAASLQEKLNETVLHKLTYFRKNTDISNLCMAGGVALNCTMNGVIARSGLFKNIFIQPAANDEGCSVGAALIANSMVNSSCSKNEKWADTYYGPEYSDNEIYEELNNYSNKIQWKREKSITLVVADKLNEGSVIGWFQGRMEFGPRALGNRSILADPRDATMKDRINSKVKHRESFRPFAPAVLEELASEYFDMTGLNNSPFMLFTVPVRKDYQNLIPAVTHVDNTSRVQTVSKKNNQLFWDLISEFKKLSGVGVLLNTSFNIKNEPIVCSPKDAILSFLNSEIDFLAIGNYLVKKRIEK